MRQPWVGVVIQRANGELEAWEIEGAHVSVSGSMNIDLFNGNVSARQVRMTIDGLGHRVYKMPRPPQEKTTLEIEERFIDGEVVTESETSGSGDTETSSE